MFEFDKYENTSDIHMIKTIKILKYLVSIINKRKNMIHVIKAPSPAATSSLSIGEYLVDMYSSLTN